MDGAMDTYCPDPDHPDVELDIAETSLESESAVSALESQSAIQRPTVPGLGTHIAEYIHTMLPATLIYIPEMRLMGRMAVQEKAQPAIEKKAMEVDAKGGYLLSRYPDSWPATLQRCTKQVLSYAILSHRWLNNGEPTFQDMQGYPRGSTLPEDPRWTGLGFQKLRRFCELARQHGCDWAWADTCCIDKSSSADLDESIRSMYRWYENSKVCIVYLAETTGRNNMAEDAWFTRGWTLQELLAPRRIKFFNKYWRPLTGAHSDKHRSSGLLPVLSQITNIPTDILRNFVAGTNLIMEKMAWAARRKTTRAEDVAYSLIGIFDVTFMTAYGEGGRAFYRLQLAIMEKTNVVDLLVWRGESSKDSTMLARSPECFLGMPPQDDIPHAVVAKDRGPNEAEWEKSILDGNIARGGPYYAMTNAGLRVELVLYPLKSVAPMEGVFLHEGWASDELPGIVVHTAFSLTEDTRPDFIAILDYEWDDANGNPGTFKHMIRKSTVWNQPFEVADTADIEKVVLKARSDREYTGIVLEKVREVGRGRRFRRIDAVQEIPVKRPDNGWRAPETVYIV